jgi:hypothetical protein
MKNFKQYINESSKSIEDEMKEWEERFKEPFGQSLKALQWTVNDEGLYKAEKTEYGFYTFTPFDNYVTAYALDGNKKYTYEHIKAICDDWDFTTNSKVNKALKELEKLVK